MWLSEAITGCQTVDFPMRTFYLNAVAVAHRQYGAVGSMPAASTTTNDAAWAH
jgi:hypothetical protein